MKKIFFLFPLILLGMRFENTGEIKPAKQEIVMKDEIPLACLAGSEKNNFIQNSEAPYVHCSTCGYGVFLGPEGKEACTYCGVKKHYVQR